MGDYLVLILFIGFIVIFIGIELSNRNKNNIKLRNSYGKEKRENINILDLNSINNYWTTKLEYSKFKYYIDNITWNDLDFDKIFNKINYCLSSCGEEILYSKLRTPSYKLEEINKFNTLVEHIDNNKEERFKLQKLFKRLDKNYFNNISHYIYNIKNNKLKRNYFYDALTILFWISLLSILINPSFGVMFILTMFSTNMYFYYKIEKESTFKKNETKYLINVLNTAKKISKFNTENEELNKLINIIKTEYIKIKKINSIGGILLFTSNDIAMIFIEYYKMATLYNYHGYRKIDSILKNNSNVLETIYESLGYIDAAYSIASYRNTINDWCKPTFIQDKMIEVKEIYHPLINDPITNSVTITKNALITGSNASGKSTFIKSLAVNGILAQTIGLVHAKAYHAPLVYHLTSMAIRDDVESNESYYIAEIKSVKRITDLVNDNIYFICYIDEILKGTNTIERIAASAAILNYLTNKNGLCIVASHDLELTKMLNDKYTNYHFNEQFNDEGIYFDYLIKDGPSTTKNAIKLLSVMNYEEEIIQQANDLANDFTKHQIWAKI